MQTENSPALLEKMKALCGSFSKAEQHVLSYIIEIPEKVIYLSVSDLAKNSGVSDATVVRACQKLGMDGYQDLKVTLAQDIVTPLQSIHEEINPTDDAATIMDKVFQSTIYTLNFTHDTANVRDIERTASEIMNARRVCIFGLGNSGSVAIDLQHKLMRLGINAAAYSDSHMQAIAASYLRNGDLVFAISHSGSSKDIVDSTRLAKKNGAYVISLTNIGNSPLTLTSDISLHTASQETKYRIVALSSRIAQSVIIDTIYTIIAMQRPSVVAGFHELEKALEQKKY
jgi:RpiR family carbohydrate utilization transcriptional regulator